jgi:transposase
MRALLIAKRSGREARITCLNQLRHLGFCAPDELRERFRGVPRDQLTDVAAALRPRTDRDPVTYATKLAMRTLARRVLALDEDNNALDGILAELAAATAPRLLELYGVGIDTAAILLVAAGDNAERVQSEAAWAHLCGVAPLPTTSGKVTQRHRLNRGGEPPSEPRPVAHRVHPHGLRTAYPHLPATPPGRRALQARDHPHPQALRRPRDLPAPPARVAKDRSGGPGPITA